MGDTAPTGGGKTGAGGLPFDTMSGGTLGNTPIDPFTAGAPSSGVLPGGFDPLSATSFADPTGSVSAQTALTSGTQNLPQTADVGAPSGVQTDATQTQTPAERISQAEQDLRPPAGDGAGEPSPELRQQGLQQLRQGMQSWQLGGQPQVPGPTGPTPAPQTPQAPQQGAGDIPENLRQQGLQQLATQMNQGQQPDWMRGATAPTPPPTQFTTAPTPQDQTAGPGAPSTAQPGQPQAPQQDGRAAPLQDPSQPGGGMRGGAPGGGAPGRGGPGGGGMSPLLGLIQQLAPLAIGALAGRRGGMMAPGPYGYGFGGRFGPGPRGGIPRGGVGGVAPYGPRGPGYGRDQAYFPPGATGGQQRFPQPGAPTARPTTAAPGAPLTPMTVPQSTIPAGGNARPIQTGSGQTVAPLNRSQITYHTPGNPPSMLPTQASVDRSSFRSELRDKPWLLRKLAHMTIGEVSRRAPLHAQIVQTETAFNRAQMRGQSLEQVLLSKDENRRLGYYQGGRNGTYSNDRPPTNAEVNSYIQNVLIPVLNGSNQSDIGYGPMTGNASAGVAGRQYGHQLGYKLQGGDSYFREPGLRKLPEVQGGGAVATAPAPNLVNPPPTPSGNPIFDPSRQNVPSTSPASTPAAPSREIAPPDANRADVGELQQFAMDIGLNQRIPQGGPEFERADVLRPRGGGVMPGADEASRVERERKRRVQEAFAT